MQLRGALLRVQLPQIPNGRTRCAWCSRTSRRYLQHAANGRLRSAIMANALMRTEETTVSLAQRCGVDRHTAAAHVGIIESELIGNRHAPPGSTRGVPTHMRGPQAGARLPPAGAPHVSASETRDNRPYLCAMGGQGRSFRVMKE